jgi:general secretion pathway protein G
MNASTTVAREGFTLIEILLVVAILGVLASIVVMSMTGQTEKARITATRITIDSIKSAVDRYEMELGKYPENLAELVKEGDEKWPGPFLDQEEVPRDHWGREFKYEIIGKRVRITSAGPDQQMGTADDLLNK